MYALGLSAANVRPCIVSFSISEPYSLAPHLSGRLHNLESEKLDNETFSQGLFASCLWFAAWARQHPQAVYFISLGL
jgi:hypothetical protein